jgi:hypothetical protein
VAFAVLVPIHINNVIPERGAMSSKKFKFNFKGPHLSCLWDLDSSWSIEKDGPLDKYEPSLLNARLEDISQKWFFIRLVYEKLITLKKTIDDKFDPEKWELTVGKEYWEFVISLNYVFLETRSLLDLLQKVHILLYSEPKNKLPDSFNDFLKNPKHLNKVTNEKYRQRLDSINQSTWIRSLLDLSGRSSIRDLQVHSAQIKLAITPNCEQSLDYNICISRGVNFPCQSPSNSVPMLETIQSILNGISGLLEDFQSAVTEKVKKLGWVHKSLKPTPN